MRRSWFVTDASPFAGSVERLASWQEAIADGIIEEHEVRDQKARVVTMLRELEPLLDDALHEKLTRVLEEWTVLQTMQGTLLVEEFASGAPHPPRFELETDLPVEIGERPPEGEE